MCGFNSKVLYYLYKYFVWLLNRVKLKQATQRLSSPKPGMFGTASHTGQHRIQWKGKTVLLLLTFPIIDSARLPDNCWEPRQCCYRWSVTVYCLFNEIIGVLLGVYRPTVFTTDKLKLSIQCSLTLRHNRISLKCRLKWYVFTAFNLFEICNIDILFFQVCWESHPSIHRACERRVWSASETTRLVHFWCFQGPPRRNTSQITA